MSDLETFKEITRAVSGVSSDDASIAKAVARVREIVGVAVPEPEPKPAEEAPVRSEKRSRDRMDRGGLDRAE